MNLTRFFSELKRRNVYKVAVAYAGRWLGGNTSDRNKVTTPSEHSSDIRFEIGHVLFIDIAGYSKLLITEQSERAVSAGPACSRTAKF